MKTTGIIKLLTFTFISLLSYKVSIGQATNMLECGYDLMTKNIVGKSNTKNSVCNRINLGYSSTKKRRIFNIKTYYNHWDIFFYDSYSNWTKYKRGVKYRGTKYDYTIHILGSEILYGVNLINDSSSKISTNISTGLALESMINYTNRSISTVEVWEGQSTIKYTTTARLKFNNNSVNIFVPLIFQFRYSLNKKNIISTEIGTYFFDESYIDFMQEFDRSYYYFGVKYIVKI